MTDIATQHDFALPCDLGYLQVVRDGSGTEHARLVQVPFGCKDKKCPPYPQTVPEEDPHDFACATMAMWIRYPEYDGTELNLRKVPARLRKRGFVRTALQIDRLSDQPLNGYSIDGDRSGRLRLLYTGSDPVTTLALIIEEYCQDLHGRSYRVLIPSDKECEGELVDQLARHAIHNPVLRELLQQNAPELFEAVNQRIGLHLERRLTLRPRKKQSMPGTCGINLHYVKDEFPVHVELHNWGGLVSHIGVVAANNRALVDAADYLADTFVGRYRVQGGDAWFDRLSDAEKLMCYVRVGRDERWCPKDKVWVDVSGTLEEKLLEEYERHRARFLGKTHEEFKKH